MKILVTGGCGFLGSHICELFRAKGWIQVKDELGREALDCGGCRAFAVADHQIAHIYVNDAALLCKTDLVTEMVKEFTELQGVVGGLYARVQELDQRLSDKLFSTNATAARVGAPQYEITMPRDGMFRSLVPADRVVSKGAPIGTFQAVSQRLAVEPRGSSVGSADALATACSYVVRCNARQPSHPPTATATTRASAMITTRRLVTGCWPSLHRK